MSEHYKTSWLFRHPYASPFTQRTMGLQYYRESSMLGAKIGP